jgi:hypothetical protein
MRYLIFWLLLLSPVLGLAQDSSSNATKTSGVIRWQRGSSNSDSIMSDGQEVKVISSDSVTISVTLIERKNWIPHAFISVENKKTERLLIDPTNWTLNVLTPKQRILLRVNLKNWLVHLKIAASGRRLLEQLAHQWQQRSQLPQFGTLTEQLRPQL